MLWIEPVVRMLTFCVAAVLLMVAGAPQHPPVPGTNHAPLKGRVMWPLGAAVPATDNAAATNLIYHGGLVETVPAVYNIFWGPQWSTGFAVKQKGFTYTNATAETYLNTFFANVGGSDWAGTQTQYCDNIDPPAFSCTGQPSAQFVTNPKGQLKGVWVDPSPVPASIVTSGLVENVTADPLETEALAAAAHFGYDVNATYFIYTPPGISATAYGSVYCAYHSETGHTTGHGVRYAFIPYVPEQSGSCGGGRNPNDAFGHGYYDGYSIASGHEYAEAITDPDNQNGTQDGWNDYQTMEDGDKCGGSKDITFGPTYFAVQPLWSNEAAGGAGACAYSRGR